MIYLNPKSSSKSKKSARRADTSWMSSNVLSALKSQQTLKNANHANRFSANFAFINQKILLLAKTTIFANVKPVEMIQPIRKSTGDLIKSFKNISLSTTSATVLKNVQIMKMKITKKLHWKDKEHQISISTKNYRKTLMMELMIPLAKMTYQLSSAAQQKPIHIIIKTW